MPVEIVIDTVPNLVKNIKDLVSREVKIGVIGETTDREPEPGESGTPPTNALLGYVHEFGLPEKNIPARPFLIPGVQSIKDDAIKGLRKAAEDALDGNTKDVIKRLTALGLKGQKAVQQRITDGPFVPLSPKTIEARARRGRKGAKKYLKQLDGGQTPDASLVKPLMDTGALRQSITFVVDDKGKKAK